MNAYELADGILAIEERMFLTKKEHQLFQNSATMLRQQQAELDRAVELYTDKAIENEALKAGKIRAYDNGVEDGRKPNTNPVKELTREDRLKLIGTLKWAEDLLREAGHDEAVDEVQDCIMLLRKASEK